MYGFIVTTHHNNYDIIKKCLECLFTSFNFDDPNYFIILYVNETKCEKVLNIKNEYINKFFDVIYISDQILGNGLTGTWNKGINFLLNKKNFNCKVITIIGHDTFLNNTYINVINRALTAENNKELKYFGPLCKTENNKLKIGLAQDHIKYRKYKLEYLLGYCLTFPVNSLIKNKLTDNVYFDEFNYPFAYNEIDWYNRFDKIGGEAELVLNSIIEHNHNRSWVGMCK